MAWTVYQGLLAVLMVSTGSINTLSTKWADQMNVTNSDNVYHPFNHPFLQAVGMFLGESFCFLAFKVAFFYQMKKLKKGDDQAMESTLVKGNHKFNPLIFLPAALLDMTGTSLMYLGLTMTYAASFQMFRGAIIIFTGILSVLFLKRKLRWFHWTGILVIIVGLVVVGVSDVLFPDDGSSEVQYSTQSIITGDVIILVAQVVGACLMVYEEKFIVKHDVPPLQVVGFEGIFGFIVLGILLIPMYYIHVGSTISGNPRGMLEDALDGFQQIGNSNLLVLAIVGNIISIAFFNFAGVSVTKEISATTRMVLDSVRTLVIWLVTLAIGWEPFHWPQILGFLILVTGMCLYNNVIILPYMRKWGWIKPDEVTEEVTDSEVATSSQGLKEDDIATSRTNLCDKDGGVYTIDYS